MRDSKVPLADSVEQSTPSKPVWHAQVRLRTWQVPWPEHAAGQMVATTRWHASPSKPEWHVHLPSVPQEPRPLHPSGHAAPGAAAVTAVLTRMVPTVFTLVLAPATLLHSVPRVDDWHQWLTLAGEPDLKPANSLSFGNSSLAIQAALDGVGVAMVQYEYVKSNLAAGSLVAPFELRARGRNGYYLGWSAAGPVSTAFTLFRDWILDEVARPS